MRSTQTLFASGSLALLLLGVCGTMAPLSAKSLFTPSEARYAAPEFGKTLPPIGFVKFCAKNMQDCKTPTRRETQVEMSPERWSMLHEVNSFINKKVAPISDQDLYGEAEVWTFPTDAGDCEDYVLLKKRELQALGFSQSAMLITVVLDEKGEGHAVLTVATDEGDYILDNRRDNVLRWDATNYKYLKRQSKTDSLQWVALIKQETKTTGTVASGK